jgi:hypothetical protein
VLWAPLQDNADAEKIFGRNLAIKLHLWKTSMKSIPYYRTEQHAGAIGYAFDEKNDLFPTIRMSSEIRYDHTGISGH